MERPELDPAELRSVAERLATEAADFVRRRREEVFSGAPQRESTGQAVRAKSTPTDPVTIVDTETERLLRDRLAELRPGEHVLGEEGGGSSDDFAGRPTWVVDPIDGTVNFVYGLPAYVVSVAVQVDGQSVAGAVANVVDGAVYSAARGHGAHVRRGATRRCRCGARQVDDLSMSLVGTGFGYDPELRRRQASVLAMLLPQVRDIRRLGSAALDLCLVAAGQLDAYYEDNLNVWDWAAGALIAAEAGARVRVPPVSGSAGGRGLVVAAAPGVDRGVHRRAARIGHSGLAKSGSAATGFDQHAPLWIFEINVGSAGCGGLRPQARQHGLDVVAARQLGEVGADREVHGVVGTLVLKEFDTWGDEPDRRGGRAAAGAEPDLALARQPVVHVQRVVLGRRIGESEVSQLPGHLRGLTALAAGVEHPDLGVGQVGGADLGHGGTRHLLAQLRLGGVAGGVVGGRVARRRLGHVGRPVEGDHPDDQGHHGQHGEHHDAGHEIAPPERPTLLVEGRALCDLSDHTCTLEAALSPLGQAPATQV